MEVGDGKRVLGENLELSTTKSLLDAMPLSEGCCEGSAPQTVGEAMVLHEVHHEVPEKPTVPVHRAECERLNRPFRQAHGKGQVTARSSLINTDASTDSPIARDDEASPSTPVVEASHRLALQDDSTSRPIHNMTAADGNLYSCEEISTILDKMTNGRKI